jgi:hypothetical protein
MTQDDRRDTRFKEQRPRPRVLWRTMQHITASPGKVGDVARAALVLIRFEHGYIK